MPSENGIMQAGIATNAHTTQAAAGSGRRVVRSVVDR